MRNLTLSLWLPESSGLLLQSKLAHNPIRVPDQPILEIRVKDMELNNGVADTVTREPEWDTSGTHGPQLLSSP